MLEIALTRPCFTNNNRLCVGHDAMVIAPDRLAEILDADAA
jgi:hypothetical protein